MISNISKIIFKYQNRKLNFFLGIFLWFSLLFKEKEVVRQFSKLGKDEFQLSLIVHLKRLKRLERISIVSRKRFSNEVIYGNTFKVSEGGNTRTPWKAYRKPSDKCFGGNFWTVSSHALRLNQSYCAANLFYTAFDGAWVT